MRTLKGVIFDLDGVLVDTEYFQWQGWIEVLRPYQININKSDYIKYYCGRTGSFIAEEFVQQHKLDISGKELLDKKEEISFNYFLNNKLKLMHYSKQAINIFIEKNLKVGLVSGGSRKEVDIKLEKTGIKNKFDITVSRNDVKNGKPYPDSYIEGLHRLGLSEKECIVFEDTSSGIKSATDAGIACVAIPSEYSIHQDFSLATEVFNNLEQACNWVLKYKCSN